VDDRRQWACSMVDISLSSVRLSCKDKKGGGIHKDLTTASGTQRLVLGG
jgi:hypothetical protein